jgi:uracil-DNA glycosylase family 4
VLLEKRLSWELEMKYVGPEGPPDARIAIVGEAPGAEEELTGRPFIGSSGKLLDDMLARVGIARGACYVTNVVKFRPPGNDFKLMYDKGRPSALLESSRQGLLDELEKVKPNVTILLGKEALIAVTGKSSLDSWRGSVLMGARGLKCLATYHPAYILRVYEDRALAELDLKKALAESTSPELHLPQKHFIVNPTFDQVIEYIANLKHARAPVGFDIETVGSRVRCLGLSNSKDSAICIPFMSSPMSVHAGNGHTLLAIDPKGGLSSHWSLEQERAILVALDGLLGDETIPKIAQNFPFDASFLCREFGLDVQGLELDTMVAFHCCYCELPKGLDTLVSVFTRVQCYWDYDASSDRETWVYNCYDASVILEIAEAEKREMKELSVYDFYYNHAQPAMLALMRAGNRGVEIDTELREKMKLECEGKLEQIKTKLAVLVGVSLNPNSPKQMKDYVYGKLRIVPKTHHKTGKSTLNEEALEWIRQHYPQHKGFVDLCLEYRGIVKLIGTFLTSELLANGRMPTSYNATGTETGRISSSETIDGMGGNLQQVNRGSDPPVRRMFIAPAGRRFVKGDLSQIQARYVALFSEDEILLEKFRDPKFDVHRFNASVIYRKPESEITKDQRQKSKGVVHATNFRGGPGVAVKQAKVTWQEAKVAIDTYLAAKPRLREWWASLEAEVSTARRLVSPMGRLRIFLGRVDHKLFRDATAHLPQATEAEVIGDAFWKLEARLPDGAFPVLQNHDEIVVECFETQVPEVARIMKREMEIEVKWKGLSVTGPVDISTGQNWLDTTPMIT